MALPENVVPGQLDHAGLHNDTNVEVNRLAGVVSETGAEISRVAGEVEKKADRAQLDAVVGSMATRAAAVTIGDSITAAGYIGPGQFSHAWWNLFSISTQGRIRFDACFATPGLTIQQIRDTHLPSVLAMPNKPGSCWVMAGTNNMLTQWDFPAMKLAYQEILDALVGAYILPCIVTIPPNNGGATKNQRITLWNAYLRNLAQQKGYPLLDAHSVLTDASTGFFKEGLYQDADHPNASGNAAIASLAATDVQLISRFPLGAPYLVRGADDGATIAAKGLFMTDANADGVADSWLQTGIGTNGSASIVNDGLTQGKWQRIKKTAAQAGQILVYQDITTGWAVGDQVQLAGKVRLAGETTPGASTGTSCSYQLQCRSSTGTALKTISPFNGVGVDIDGVTSSFGIIPEGTTVLRIQIIVNGTATQDMHLDVAQATVTNLTTLGMVM